MPKVPEPPEQIESTQFPPMLTVELLARLLFISKTSVYELINKEGLPWVPILKQKRFVTSEVLEWAKRKQSNGGVPA